MIRENLPAVHAVRLAVEKKTKRQWKEQTKIAKKRVKDEHDHQNVINRSQLLQKVNEYLE